MISSAPVTGTRPPLALARMAAPRVQSMPRMLRLFTWWVLICALPKAAGPPPSAFAYLAATAQGTDVADFDDASASGSGGEGQTAICLGRAECRVIDYIKDWRVTRPVVGIFLGLFIVLMIPTVRHPRCPHQATVGLKSLFSDRDDLSW